MMVPIMVKKREKREKGEKIKWSKMSTGGKVASILLGIFGAILITLLITEGTGLTNLLSPITTSRNTTTYNITVVNAADPTEDLSDDDDLVVEWYQIAEYGAMTEEERNAVDLSEMTLLNIESLNFTPQVDCAYILHISLTGFTEYWGRTNEELMASDDNAGLVDPLAIGDKTIALTELAEYMNLKTSTELGDSAIPDTEMNEWKVTVLCLNETLGSNAEISTEQGVASFFSLSEGAEFGLCIAFNFDDTIVLADMTLTTDMNSSKYIIGNSMIFVIYEDFIGQSSEYSFSIAQDIDEATGLNYDFDLVSISGGYSFVDAAPTVLVTAA